MDQLKTLAKAIALTNNHPDPEFFADQVAAHFAVLTAIPPDPVPAEPVALAEPAPAVETAPAA